MREIAAVGGLLLIGVVLVDAFETIILPRRVTRRGRLARLFGRTTWRAWTWVAGRIPTGVGTEGTGPRDRFLSLYGPLALLFLLGLWAGLLVLGFDLLQWGFRALAVGRDDRVGLATGLYASGVCFFTIGFGDVLPRHGLGRFLAVAEGATGFSFLALIISYLPLIFGTLSAREEQITLLDARAGSPPTATELLRRLAPGEGGAELNAFLREWERWASQLLESHLSYPILAYFRSQHERQSWLEALTMILDACALVIVGVDDDAGPIPARQARLTFAIARHAVGDLSQVFNAPPVKSLPNRLPPTEVERLRQELAAGGVALREGAGAERQLVALRTLYEPYVAALANRLWFTLPPWIRAPDAVDDWETTAWQYDRMRVVRAMAGEPDPDESTVAA
jgi:Ion channel